ncbi:histidine phosphatase family protein [Polaribacter sp.]|nr:histidine phosphatase family protein [Polaribacter sp.]|tara:strand:+ start:96 stop:587 length:492 start_codon:yes stop_codon:yes gene_type:complete
MKKLQTLLLFILLGACNSNETTTYYLIRHAEKDRTDATNSDPNLNSEGLIRAHNWAKYFDTIALDAVYSSDYKRTQQTAEPTAAQQGLRMQFYDPNSMYDAIFQKVTLGKAVLVVGHSNTTPAFANLILEQEKYQSMNDKDNSSLYVVIIQNGKKTSRIVNMH